MAKADFALRAGGIFAATLSFTLLRLQRARYLRPACIPALTMYLPVSLCLGLPLHKESRSRASILRFLSETGLRMLTLHGKPVPRGCDLRVLPCFAFPAHLCLRRSMCYSIPFTGMQGWCRLSPPTLIRLISGSRSDGQQLRGQKLH